MFTSAIAVVLVSFVPLAGLAGTTSLLLLAVFTLVNITCLVLRRKTVEHEHFRARLGAHGSGRCCAVTW